MDEDIADEEALLFFLLRRHHRGQKPKKLCKKPRFWARDIFGQMKQYGEYYNYSRKWKLEIENFILGVLTYFSYWLDIYLVHIF